jgi:hypothetical protein
MTEVTDLDTLAALLAEMTPPPWCDDCGKIGDENGAGIGEMDDWADGTGIVALVNAADSLIAAARRTTDAEAMVAALREALEWAERLAYGVPGALSDDDDAFVPDERVDIALRRDRMAARAVVKLLADTATIAAQHDANIVRDERERCEEAVKWVIGEADRDTRMGPLVALGAVLLRMEGSPDAD